MSWVAVFPFTPPADSDRAHTLLTVPIGGTVSVLRRNGDWWLARFHGKTGRIPGNYLVPLSSYHGIIVTPCTAVPSRPRHGSDDTVPLEAGTVVEVLNPTVHGHDLTLVGSRDPRTHRELALDERYVVPTEAVRILPGGFSALQAVQVGWAREEDRGVALPADNQTREKFKAAQLNVSSGDVLLVYATDGQWSVVDNIYGDRGVRHNSGIIFQHPSQYYNTEKGGNAEDDRVQIEMREPTAAQPAATTTTSDTPIPTDKPAGTPDAVDAGQTPSTVTEGMLTESPEPARRSRSGSNESTGSVRIRTPEEPEVPAIVEPTPSIEAAEPAKQPVVVEPPRVEIAAETPIAEMPSPDHREDGAASPKPEGSDVGSPLKPAALELPRAPQDSTSMNISASASSSTSTTTTATTSTAATPAPARKDVPADAAKVMAATTEAAATDKAPEETANTASATEPPVQQPTTDKPAEDALESTTHIVDFSPDTAENTPQPPVEKTPEASTEMPVQTVVEETPKAPEAATEATTESAPAQQPEPEPVVKPEEPVSKPEEVVAKPEEVAPKPEEIATKPVEPAAEPVVTPALEPTPAVDATPDAPTTDTGSTPAGGSAWDALGLDSDEEGHHLDMPTPAKSEFAPQPTPSTFTTTATDKPAEGETGTPAVEALPSSDDKPAAPVRTDEEASAQDGEPAATDKGKGEAETSETRTDAATGAEASTTEAPVQSPAAHRVKQHGHHGHKRSIAKVKKKVDSEKARNKSSRYISMPTHKPEELTEILNTVSEIGTMKRPKGKREMGTIKGMFSMGMNPGGFGMSQNDGAAAPSEKPAFGMSTEKPAFGMSTEKPSFGMSTGEAATTTNDDGDAPPNLDASTGSVVVTGKKSNPTTPRGAATETAAGAKSFPEFGTSTSNPEAAAPGNPLAEDETPAKGASDRATKALETGDASMVEPSETEQESGMVAPAKVEPAMEASGGEKPQQPPAAPADATPAPTAPAAEPTPAPEPAAPAPQPQAAVLPPELMGMLRPAPGVKEAKAEARHAEEEKERREHGKDKDKERHRHRHRHSTIGRSTAGGAPSDGTPEDAEKRRERRRQEHERRKTLDLHGSHKDKLMEEDEEESSHASELIEHKAVIDNPSGTLQRDKEERHKKKKKKEELRAEAALAALINQAPAPAPKTQPPDPVAAHKKKLPVKHTPAAPAPTAAPATPGGAPGTPSAASPAAGADPTRKPPRYGDAANDLGVAWAVRQMAALIIMAPGLGRFPPMMTEGLRLAHTGNGDDSAATPSAGTPAATGATPSAATAVATPAGTPAAPEEPPKPDAAAQAEAVLTEGRKESFDVAALEKAYEALRAENARMKARMEAGLDDDDY